jgi:hypothetical protein
MYRSSGDRRALLRPAASTRAADHAARAEAGREADGFRLQVSSFDLSSDLSATSALRHFDPLATAFKNRPARMTPSRASATISERAVELMGTTSPNPSVVMATALTYNARTALPGSRSAWKPLCLEADLRSRSLR